MAASIASTTCSPLTIVRFFVLGYCAWQATDLGTAWRSHSPEAWGGLMLALWLVPAIRSAFRDSESDRPQERLLAAAVCLSFVGQITWLNCLQHLALALAIAGWRQPQPHQRVWLAAALLWMPACGWFVDGVFAGWETLLRIAAIAATTICVLRGLQRPPRMMLLAIMALSMPTTARGEAFAYSPVQSPARPFGLNIVDGVGLAGSDAASADFLNNTLPDMQQMIDQNLGERVAISNQALTGDLTALDPAELKLSVATDVRLFFVGEGAGYHNSMGFNTEGGGISTGNPLLIFPDASSPNSYLSSGNGTRTASQPLFPGDFVDLGSFDAGTQLDFFLIANGANGGQNLYSTDSSLNGDGLDHVVAFAQAESPYLLIGFEDLWNGGDKDYNDLLFAVYFGEQNVDTLTQTASLHGVPAPEPGFLWLIVMACGGWLNRVRRKRADRTTC